MAAGVSRRKGSGRKKELLRASVSVKTLTVSSIEELDTRSMSLQTRPRASLPVSPSHMSDADFSRASARELVALSGAGADRVAAGRYTSSF